MKSWLFSIWLIVDLLLFVAVISLWITAPEFKTLNIGLTIFTFSLGFILLLSRINEISKFVRSRYFEKLTFHVINTLLFLSILGVVNYLGNKNFKEFDLTKEKRNSLTDQSLKIISEVKSPMKMTVFGRREEWASMLNLLKLYTAQNRLISLDAIDTDVRPDIVKSKGITQNGTILIEYKGKESSFLLNDELSVTNAILKSARSNAIVLYFITGHQELNCSDTTQEGISDLCKKLRSQNYVVKTLDLTKVSKVPGDASAVLVLGPISGFLKQEVDILNEYVIGGGSFFLALAPAFKLELYDNLIGIVKKFGLVLGKDIVIDRLSTIQGAEATIPIIDKYEENHAITKGFNLRTVFPLSSSVSKLPGHDMAVILAKTSSFPGSWAERNLQGVTKGKAQFNEKMDEKGPIGLIGVSEGTGESSTRVVLLGSSSFLINAYQSQTGNSTLFLNTVSWVVNDEGIISFNRPGTEEYPVILSAQHLQMIFVISILVVPIVFFGAGIFIYRRRRLL